MAQRSRANRRDRDHLAAAETARHGRALIVIDPGHGGRDGGTVGRSGTLEKNVTLAAARELCRLLLATRRYRVMLTRADDRYVSLERRLALGAARGVALLISLHADASPDHALRGASVIIHSGNETASRLRRIGGAPVNPRAIARALRAGGAPHPEQGSEFLQSRLVDSLDDDIRMAETPSRADRLYVLANKATPSVLVEMGYLSNRHDEALLGSPRYQRVIASAIRDALDEYFAAVRG